MSKQKSPQVQQIEPSKKNLTIENFYIIHDGSPSGHPGLLIWKDDDVNLYLAIKFGSSGNKENFELKIHYLKKNPKVFAIKDYF